MTDRELMQQALDALTQANQCIFTSAKLPFPPALNATSKAIEALRARLAEPEPKHDDPIGEAARPCKVGGPCVPTQTGSCACEELPQPIGPVVEQPQMQPCAGRNCGSTNPNLHSAECFEDYEKATGMRAWQGLTDDEVNNFAAGCHLGKSVQGAIYEAAAKLKEKNA